MNSAFEKISICNNLDLEFLLPGHKHLFTFEYPKLLGKDDTTQAECISDGYSILKELVLSCESIPVSKRETT